MKLQDLPMSITWLRVALIPLFILIYYLPFETARFVAMLVFVIAALTDWLDGYLARRLDATSKFGAFLDPVADKLIVAVALVMVAVEYQDLLITLAAIVIIMREVAVSALREWMAQQKLSDVVAVSKIGKYKTTFQLVALAMLIYGGNLFGVPWPTMGFGLLMLAALLTLWSFVQYSIAAWPKLR
ncbi:CDP-diacylglycerol--glycerol-3-phosphate 3-phosphatidyltransferase [Thiomicrospira aerophila AL3]|uniref:CDP-diacylglycerol--glycerol-3-phosphate 3-phosphatidyltransferase n=1 Tax=Thiomicrospira aerophila AL3 TaxID=717772 RepID=W0DWA0_9GAMM|nr:CDP-diacylglycerol--glycerol-3-phosphate 3-phosphatidyltransferase [Thiomicrospira aerophila]AHF01259.1 CDP-diacylglycerol--glycerol-3-phosphate 3-phosphatidyltransferase [Thiomicrospira aerophila AL3]